MWIALEKTNKKNGVFTILTNLINWDFLNMFLLTKKDHLSNDKKKFKIKKIKKIFSEFKSGRLFDSS